VLVLVDKVAVAFGFFTDTGKSCIWDEIPNEASK
jgi:hypothetical protein